MAVLDKLSICGIRSFGPSQQEQVEFSTPLTLFLGQNGCGKTTLIESIKYALTGEFPSGTKNGSGFVNDPKLTNKSSVKGSIKVRFRDVKNEYITVVRVLEVTTKANGDLTSKKLNNSIRWEDAERSNSKDISGRCVNIDDYCAGKLNVSKQVLNHVILCHQENSSWPLEEAKKLKERFDLIFGAAEYNKCVDLLRNIIKEKQINIKLLKVELEARKQAKKNVESVRDKLDARKEKLEAINEQIEEKNKLIDPMEIRMGEILDLENVLGSLKMDLTGKEKSLEGVLDQQKTIEKTVSYIFQGTDEELEAKIQCFQKEQDKIDIYIREMEQKKKDVDNKITESSRELQKIQVNIGQLKEEENQHKKKCEERDTLIQEAVVKMNVKTSRAVDIQVELLKSSLKTLEMEFNKLVETKDAEEINLQNSIDSTRESYATAKQSLNSNEVNITECTNKVTQLSQKLQLFDESDKHYKVVEERIEKLKSSYRKIKEDFDERIKVQELQKIKDEIQNKEKLLEEVEMEYRTLQQNYATEQALHREKSMKIDKLSEICAIKSKYGEEFQVIFGHDIPKNNYQEAVQKIQEHQENEYQLLTNRLSDLEKQLAGLSTTIRLTEQKLKHEQKELQINKSKVEEICRGRNFNEVLKECSTKREKLNKDKGQYRSAKVMYEAFINQFQNEKPCCPVCETDFASKRSLAANIVQNLKRKIEEVPKKLLVVESDLEKEDSRFNKLQQLIPVSNAIEELENIKIPFMESELREFEEKYEEAAMVLAATKSEMESPRNVIDTCRKVMAEVALLDQYLSDIAKCSGAIEDLEKHLAGVPSNRTREEAEAEVDTVKADLSNLRKQYDTKKKLFDQTKERLEAMYMSMNTEIQKNLETQKKMQEKPMVQEQRKELAIKLRKLKEERKSLNESLGKLEKELQNVVENRQRIVEKNKVLKAEKRNELQLSQRLVDDIQKLQTLIHEFETSDIQKRLDIAINCLETINSKIHELEKNKSDIVTAISEKRESVAGQSNKYRTLVDNQTLREIKVKVSRLENEICAIKKQIGNYNYKTVYEEKRKIEKKMDEYRREINVWLGEQREIEKSVREFESELNRKENKNATKEFLKKYYELRVQELMTNDLDNYTRALEQSILKFHKERMVHINKTIRELWRSIYKGNDIDYIEIQTKDTVGGAGGKKRSYDYKVVQVKKGVELEMRGRCSAGQRVLACLVIRMALSETFSANCGILALDEPTTNLDRENIASLSDALSKIITARERQRNFQLLVITHDEEFLHTLTREQSISHYWRVQRNAEGFSEIKKEIL